MPCSCFSLSHNHDFFHPSYVYLDYPRQRLSSIPPVWTPVVLSTLNVVEPKMRHGAVVITDNTIGAARGYKDLLEYLRTPESGYINMTLPFSKGLEMSVYLPQK